MPAQGGLWVGNYSLFSDGLVITWNIVPGETLIGLTYNVTIRSSAMGW